MRHWMGLLALVFTVLYIPVALANSPVGNWTIMDDKTRTKRAIIRIDVSGKTMTGTVVRVFPQPGDSTICSLCPGAFKDKSTLGLQFIWGLQEKGNGEWEDGHILNPKTGKIYRAKITAKENKLFVRGFIGFSPLGRTQVWVR